MATRRPNRHARPAKTPKPVPPAPTSPPQSRNVINLGGRPTKYHAGIPAMAKAAVEEHLTDEQIQHIMGISPRTWWRWRHAHPEFRTAVTRSKETANKVMEASLFQRGTGYSVEAVKIFMTTEVTEKINKRGQKTITRKQVPVAVEYLEHIPGDVGAMALYLHNRDPDRYRKTIEPPPPPPETPEDEAHRKATYDALMDLVKANAKAGGQPILNKPAELPAPTIIKGSNT